MSRQPVLGIIGLDDDDATEESSAELAERAAVTPWVIEDPASWPVPFVKAIARGANAADNKIPRRPPPRGSSRPPSGSTAARR